MRGVLRPFQKAPLNERLDRLRDFLHLVPQKSGELFTGQERSRMSMEENEQVEVAGRANDGSAGKKPLDLFHAGTVCGTLVAHKPIPIRPHGSLSAQEKRRPKIAGGRVRPSAAYNCNAPSPPRQFYVHGTGEEEKASAERLTHTRNLSRMRSNLSGRCPLGILRGLLNGLADGYTTCAAKHPKVLEPAKGVPAGRTRPWKCGTSSPTR